MSKALYDVVGGATRNVKKQYAVIDGVARKIKKSYQVVDGAARLFYSGGVEVNYTGAHTASAITVGGVAYNLYTLTGSGTLTVSEPVQYWMCGGGGSGAAGYVGDYAGNVNGWSGGGGAGGYVASGTLTAGEHVVTVGAAGGKSSIGAISAAKGGDGSATKGGSGGTGGGAGASGLSTISIGTSGTGAGVSTYPFGVTSLKAHCPGGGGGAAAQQVRITRGAATGGVGASHGNSGGRGSFTGGYLIAKGGNGGTYGGGKGGDAGKAAVSDAYTVQNGSAATFYGGGGGGGGVAITGGVDAGSGGAGYQGVVYLLVPAA